MSSSETRVAEAEASTLSKKDQRQEQPPPGAPSRILKKHVKGLEKELERRTAELQTIEQTLSDERTYSDMPPDELNTLLAKAGKLRQTVRIS